MPGGDDHRYSGNLSGTHYCLHIVLGKHPFNGNCGRVIARNPVLNHLFDSQEATCHIELWWGADHVDRDQERLPAWNPVDHSKAASGQAGVDSQHPHAFPQVSRDRIAHAIPLNPE
jgi:hypothetical protein